jgi:hypothetical protein
VFSWHLGIRFHVFPSFLVFFWRKFLVLCNERVPFLGKILFLCNERVPFLGKILVWKLHPSTKKGTFSRKGGAHPLHPPPGSAHGKVEIRLKMREKKLNWVHLRIHDILIIHVIPRFFIWPKQITKLACFVTIWPRMLQHFQNMYLGTLYIYIKFRPDRTSNMAAWRPSWKIN